MIIFLLLLSIAAYVTVMIGMGQLGKNVFQNAKDRMYFQLIRNFFCIIMMAVIGRAFVPSGFTLFLAACMGMATLLSSVTSLACFKYGPVSISILIYSSLSMLISSLAGPIFWGESISFLQIVGIVLCLASMTLLTERSLVEKTRPIWFLFLILAGIGGGLQGPIQKVLATSAYAGERMEFITYTFIFSTITPLILLAVAKLKDRKNPETAEKVTYKLKGYVFWMFLLQAALSVFLNINNLKLVAELPTVVFFPSYSIGGLLITTLASRFLFNEKMTARQTAGFVTGLCALLLISGILG